MISLEPPTTEADALRAELGRVRESLRLLCEEWAADHTHAQTVALRAGVPPAKVEGDSHGVPGIQDLVDMIAERLPSKP